jgi:uncharacterized protein
MSSVLVDTVGLLALWDEDDQWHTASSVAFERLFRDGTDLITTTFVLAESGNAVARKDYRWAVEKLRADFENTNRLVNPTQRDWQETWECYHRREGNSAGIVDCVSFVVMRRLGIVQAFTNDEHFRAAGFETLF